MKKHIAKYGAIGVVIITAVAILALVLNSLIAGAVFWASNTLFGTEVSINFTNMLAGGVILTFINVILSQMRGDDK